MDFGVPLAPMYGTIGGQKIKSLSGPDIKFDEHFQSCDVRQIMNYLALFVVNFVIAEWMVCSTNLSLSSFLTEPYAVSSCILGPVDPKKWPRVSIYNLCVC